ncbi:MAG TPA: hypothetical protein VEU54_02140 [Steroidobacteraceae bacterium]|jgi:hypothetical protein|nr:hypothetical protein [Steroidobacteraceae bacterium]
MRILLAALLLVPAAALAGSAFDGTWKTKPETMQQTGKPDAYQIVNGEYTCSSCSPAFTVKADGKYHEAKGNPYRDSVAVTVLSPTSVHVSTRLAGKVTLDSTLEVSADGAKLTGRFTDHTGAKAATASFTEKRVTAGPPGSHAISGSWQPERVSGANDALLTYQYAMTPDGFNMHWNGQSYDAKFDGKEYPVAGDPGHTQVTLKRIDAHTVLETDRRQGKVTDEIRLAVASDGKTMNVEDKDLAHGQTTTMTLEKQQ